MTDQELDARFESLTVGIRAEIKAEGVTTRHHFDVVTANIRAEIRSILNGRLERLDDRSNSRPS